RPGERLRPATEDTDETHLATKSTKPVNIIQDENPATENTESTDLLEGYKPSFSRQVFFLSHLSRISWISWLNGFRPCFPWPSVSLARTVLSRCRWFGETRTT